MKGYIYRIENKINGNNYIGKTYSTIEQRWKDHIKASKKEISKDRPLYRAINKYGIENFEILEIEYCEGLEEREKYWISYYDTYKNGYNATLGGDGKAYFEPSDEEVIQKYKELKYIDSVAKYFKCDKKTIRTRLKNNGIEIKNDYQNNNWGAREIDQFDLNENYIQSFPSMSKAAEWIIENNYSDGRVSSASCNISRSANGIKYRRQAYGFIWKFPV